MRAGEFRDGRYDVIEHIGTGGMGEVFRARDRRLGREVALKVLPERFELDPQRLARFEREARILASLNHANIATLHEIEKIGERHALILELVDGVTLAERIADGPIPVPDALGIACQIAAALEAAHEAGVIHRDLKPANVKLRRDGSVKLLDFGLAKVFDPVVAATESATATALDAPAVIGTPAYMSPEQARGLAVDKRTDIWAFGCLLFEMLTGRPAFAGDGALDVLAKVVQHDVDLTALPAATPQSVRRILARCFVKEPRRRLRDIGDASLELVESQADAPAATRPVQLRSAASALLAAVLVIALAGALAALRLGGGASPAAAPVVRFTIPLTDQPNPAADRTLAVAPDGARLAFITEQGLFVRSRDRLDVTPLHRLASPGAGSPFFSPDGQWIGFSGGQTLLKVPVGGEAAVTLAEVGPAASGSWSGNDIVFADMHGVFRVPAAGGRPTPVLTDFDRFEQALSPQLIPERQAIVFTVIPTRTNTPRRAMTARGARVEVLDLATGERRPIMYGGGLGHYVPTGHLIYVSGETLYAVRFDLDELEARGEPVALESQARVADFAVSAEGTLVYTLVGVDDGTLVWVDRHGREEALGTPPKAYIYPRLSPDGTRVAVDVAGADRDIWIWDLHRSTLERFTLDPSGNALLAWSPDGRKLAFGSDRFGVTNLFWQATDRSGEPEHLVQSDRTYMPLAFGRDGRLLFSADVAGHGRDVYALSLDGSRRIEPILNGVPNELTVDVSPDGKWIAYDSDESGQYEIYVRPYPDAYSGGRWQISSGGGRQPVWSRDGGEIYFRDFTGAMLAASVTLTPRFEPGPVVKLFESADYAGGGPFASGRTYDVSADGRFLMVKQRVPAAPVPPVLVVVLNWFQELERLVP